jgi:hypothetical protein
MGKKSPPAPPPPPDPYATADAQAAADLKTATANANLNRIDQTSPWGSTTYNVVGTNPDGTPKYHQNTSLSPSQQQQLDAQNKLSLALTGFAGEGIDKVKTAMNAPMSFDGAPGMATSVDTSGLHGYGNAPAPGQFLKTFGDAGNVQKGLDYNGVTRLPGTDDFGAERQRMEDAMYSRQTSRLDAQFGNQLKDKEARLTAMGIPRGSDAWNREMQEYSFDKNDAYAAARNDAITAGSGEQSRLFGLSLGARQQEVGERTTQGQFANQSQQQLYDQLASRAGFYNQAVDNQFDNGMASAAFDNATRAQQYQEEANNATMQNQARQQYIQEQAYLRNLPLNEIAALLGTGGTVSSPTFNPVSQVTMQAPDVMGAVYNSAKMTQDQWAQQQAAKQSMMGSIFGLGGALGSAAIMSDRRIKENIVHIGETLGGIPTYVFNYIGSKLRQFGVMAQEVSHVPGAVVDGTVLRVNYRKVWQYV